MNINFIKKHINSKYFDLPKGFLKSQILAHKFRLNKASLEIKKPCIFICNSSCEYDAFLLRTIFKFDYVVLKKSIISKINSNTLSPIDKRELIRCINQLKDDYISLVVFADGQTSVFGRTNDVSKEMSEFLFECNQNLKFINFVNSYYVKPIWARNFRKTETYFKTKNEISYSALSTMSEDERNYKINAFMPSSAATYSQKTHAVISSNHLTCGLDTIIFACPNCKQFFTFESEFNNLKCNNCGVPFEFTQFGHIYSNGKLLSLDYIEDFLQNIIKETDFKNKKIVSYENIDFLIYLDDTPMRVLKNMNIEIFDNKAKITTENFEKIIYYKDVVYFEFLPSNELKFYLNTKEVLSIKGTSNENLYIIVAILNNKKAQQ